MLICFVQKTEKKTIKKVLTGYSKYTVLVLVELIVGKLDKNALNELLSRRMFFVKDKRLNVPEYIAFLKDNFKRDRYASVFIFEKAVDITLSKFSNIPNGCNGEIDCRRYFRPFLRRIKKSTYGMKLSDQEKVAAEELRRFILRHYRWSLSDAARKKGFSKCYVWNINGASYRLRMPAEMTAKQCRNWLESNVEKPQSEGVKAEKMRLQGIIDTNLFVPSMIPLGTDCFDEFTAKTPTPLQKVIEAEMASKPLSVCIANEKADNLDSLRNSIARIGKEKVRELVVSIFDAISTDNYKPSVLAKDFGVSPAAMTRFASLKWKNSKGNSNIPQLWANTARYLVNLPQYSKILYETGLYNKLSSIVLED